MSVEFELSVKEKGFNSLKEFHELTALVNFNNLSVEEFRKWQYLDRTKSKLKDLIVKSQKVIGYKQIDALLVKPKVPPLTQIELLRLLN